ncbi:hypothetical protein [Amycolatopsis sp. MJM2582]|uniref:hypothetical protein n=1 Tax=Amycolatopsis sp. MJM2582 TaxID=1427749 RepID=UPI001269E2D0|nr:hypothetical protein [Amycolatopsis sp. MJM2582]
MSTERLLWARRAQELRFHQLDAVRKQAESWRTGLASLTGLFSAVLVIKGRDNLTSLSAPFAQLVAALFALALIMFVVATLSAVRAASGVPGDTCLLAGEDLEAWTRNETAEASRKIVFARRISLVGVFLVATTTGLAWFAPARSASEPTVVVESINARYCGGLAGVSGGSVIVHTRDSYQVIPSNAVTSIRVSKSCP